MAASVTVKVTPRAAREEIVGWQGEVLQVRVTAPPTDGRANEAVLQLLARALGVPLSRMSIRRGHTSRTKVVSVEGLTLDEARSRLSH